MVTGPLNNSGEERQGGIQVIARSAAILRALGTHPGGLSLAAIARAVDLPRSTVQRIVCALEAEYLVEPMGPGGGFRLGPAVGRLLYQTQTDIISLVHPYLVRLVVEREESAYLSCLSGDQIHVIDRVIAEQILRVVFPVGASVSIHSTAPGKAILATMGTEEIDRILPGVLTAQTEKTVTDPLALKLSLESIRRNDYAREVDEQQIGISSCAVALNTYLGVFAIGLVFPSARLAGAEAGHAAALQAAKVDIERRIGAVE